MQQCTWSYVARSKACRSFSPTAFRASVWLACLLVIGPPQSPISAQSKETLQKGSSRTSAAANAEDVGTLKVKVGVVLLRVVVRESNGTGVGGLRAEDFRIFDNGKVQAIKYFDVQDAPAPAAPAPAAPRQANLNGAEHPSRSPNHSIAYLFDDVHLSSADLLNAKRAADRQLATLLAADQVALFSTSGKAVLDFTSDRVKFRESLMSLTARPLRTGIGEENLDIEVPGGVGGGAAMAQNALNQETAIEKDLNEQQEARISLAALQLAVRRVSRMPGLKTVVVISPGFSASDLNKPYDSLVQLALGAGVVVNALDPRGLIPGTASSVGCDLSEHCALTGPSGHVRVDPLEKGLEELQKIPVVRALSYDSGGIMFRSNNDLDGGFKRVASLPEHAYVLGFSPQNLKEDDSFHKLRVKLTRTARFQVQARRGYYATREARPELRNASNEIEEQLLSREEVQAFPMKFETQFFRSSAGDVHLTVVVHTDVKPLHFRKVDGFNQNRLTLACALFEDTGSYITGTKQLLAMNLRDETLAATLESGVTMKAEFDAKPGRYVVRVVVRDDEGQLSASDSIVDMR